MIKVWKKVTQLLNKKQRSRVILIFVMMILGAFLEMIGVSLMIPLVSAIMQPNIIEENVYVEKVCAWFGISSNKSFMIICIVTLIAVYIVKDLYLLLEYYVQYRFIYNNQLALQETILHSYLKRPYVYYLQIQTGEIIQVIQKDVELTFALLATMLNFFTESVVAVTLIITIFVINPTITAFTALMMAITLFVIAKVIKPILKKEGIAYRKYGAKTNQWLIQAINGIKEVKVTNKEMFFEQNFSIGGRKMICAEKRRAVWNNAPRLLIEMITICSVLSLIAILIARGEEIGSLIPALSAFAMAAVKLLPSANRIATAINSIAFQESSLDKLLDNIKALDEIKEESRDNQISVFDFKKEILLKDITFLYPNTESCVLEQANMSVPIGMSVGIIGASGAGKTTVVDIMLGLLKPQMGQVLADGVNIQNAYHAWLSHVGYIPQMIFMLDDTIRGNVAFGIDEKEINDHAVWKALEEAQMKEFVQSLPDGLDTKIGERGIRLSGGQRQRIGIARALYTDPQLLIFDEATSALDNETESAIMEAINALHGKKTMVIIAHRLTTIEGCDIVYKVGNGKIERER